MSFMRPKHTSADAAYARRQDVGAAASRPQRGPPHAPTSPPAFDSAGADPYAMAAVSAYEQLHPGGEGTVGEEGWLFLMESAAHRLSIQVPRAHLSALFSAAESSGPAGTPRTINLYQVLGM